MTETAPETALTDAVSIGNVDLPNRLYRAPLLECAGNGPDAVKTLIDELEPTAASGVGLIFQGASIVTESGGCAAPNMTRFHDPEFVTKLSRLTERIHDHGSKIFVQLAEGGLRSMSMWHAEYRDRHPEAVQKAVSRPPWQLRLADRAGIINLQTEVLSTPEVRELAEAFGRAAGYAVDAGYDGVHLSGANMGIIQQFLSPYYNGRDDEFSDGVQFLLAVREAVRKHAGDVPLVTKVPVETASPPFVRRHLTREDSLGIARRLATAGYDALVPVDVSVYWDMSVVRGAYPQRAWKASELQTEYATVFGGRWRARAVSFLNRLESMWYDRDPGWNADLCRAVREAVDIPVLCEGGIRKRSHCDRLLGDSCDLVGMARPFYAEPRLGARLLDGKKRALCESCNNCAIPQATGEPGRCRTPSVVRERARLEKEGVYDRDE
ncbi:NADH:flavin oxidoreductase [Halovenus rubra]|uniref:NADH:flavin oxidoreductase n=2 Tax=Halovenus rubra TaxID=869890 RepID=A0ABD5X3R0_9EURY|nr:NADH:flavin oxidoreductase [Halovenus rubra]